jgi:hypothetical protein
MQSDTKICPGCGAAVTGGVWPPRPAGHLPSIGRFPALMTNSETRDILLGIAHALVFAAFCGIGLFGVIIVYRNEREHYPVYARTVVWAYIVLSAALIALFGMSHPGI